MAQQKQARHRTLLGGEPGNQGVRGAGDVLNAEALQASEERRLT
jgi:hypothetical protein